MNAKEHDPLVTILIELATDPILAEEFRRSPETVLAGRSLSPQEVAALTSRDADAIREALGDEAAGAFIVIFVNAPEGVAPVAA